MSDRNRTHKQTNKKSPMAYFLFFLLLSSLNAVLCQQRNSNISLSSSLKPTTGSWWPSPSGIYAFGFYQQNNGYAVGIFLANITEKTVVWTANRDNPTVSSNVTLMLTADGRLILQQRGGQDVSVASPIQPIASASMLDNGNFVLYSSNMSIIWQSFDYPTNTLLPGQRLPAGGELFSSASATDYSRGIFLLAMQSDGNLVQYPAEIQAPSYAYYASGTYGAGNNVSLNLDTDGRLYLLNGSSFLRNLTIGGYPTTRTVNLMRIDPDGIFRVYSYSLDPNGNSTVRWSSTDDKCAPKGLCGLNSYCIQMDEVPDCICLPGFDFIQSGNWSGGCTRTIISEGCTNTIHFDIQSLDNTVWDDNPYAVLELNTEEDCKQACNNDCNCEAAFFKNGNCRKQRLPLRYGRRLLTDSNVALVKVITPAPPVDKQGKEVKKVRRLDILIISISLLVVAAIILAFSWIYVQSKHVGAYKKMSASGEVKLIEEVSLRAFTYGELAQATNDFKEELGKGASGTVYRGILENSKKAVAVKRLEKDFADGDREFQTEMKVIGKTYHRNLVRLLGYCIDQTKRLLVYEYMSNGSLADLLFKSKNEQQIPSWEERMKIARHIARGILYLHEECEIQIIHCDIKPQNILLDQQGCAKLADFGLAKLLKQNQTNTYTGIRGTKGYVAPEWHQKQPVTVKADVYSFGIVLLEIICCRKSVDWSLPEDEAILDEWVYDCYEKGEIGKLVENQLFTDKTKVERMVKIGIWCIQEEPSLRPSMNKVVLMLQGTVQIPVPPNPTSFLSSSI